MPLSICSDSEDDHDGRIPLAKNSIDSGTFAWPSIMNSEDVSLSVSTKQRLISFDFKFVFFFVLLMLRKY